METWVEERIRRYREAEDLEDLEEITGEESKEEAYFEAKSEWYELMEEYLGEHSNTDDRRLPGDIVEFDVEHDRYPKDKKFHIHGISHTGRNEEKNFLQSVTEEFVEEGNQVYCEQGFLQMYFKELTEVEEIDDYSWMMSEASEMSEGEAFEGLSESEKILDGIQNFLFSLIAEGGDFYGQEIEDTIGEGVTPFLTTKEEKAVGEGFESFVRTDDASKNPKRVIELQNYYKKVLLPVNLERKWLKKHNPELDLLTHARSERIADYVIHDVINVECNEVRIIVGAAHQCGVAHYLNQYRKNEKSIEENLTTYH